MRYFLDKVHELAAKGFVVEILADGWGNWKFKEDGRPDYSTATPAPEMTEIFAGAVAIGIFL